MHILVTGGAGFVGSHVAEHFARLGHQVTILDNFSRNRMLGVNIETRHNLEHFKKQGLTIKSIEGDIRDLEFIKKNVSDADAVAHTAAQVAVTSSLKNPREDFEVNALGTFNVLEYARLHDCAIAVCSTNKVYGENVNSIPVVEKGQRYEFADERYREGIPEDFPIDNCGHSPYGCSKASADLYAQDYAHTYGLRTAVFRMSCIYGERQLGIEDQGWVAWFAIANQLAIPITIYGDGKQVRDVLHVSDLVRAFELFLTKKVSSCVLNIGGGPSNTLSLLELLTLLKSKTKIRYAKWRAADQKVYISDIQRAATTLDWAPKVSPSDGIAGLSRWVAQNHEFIRQTIQA
jgi:CDP-paratose 2-epimerase